MNLCINRDHLPQVEWLTYGSGYQAGLKLGDMPLVEFTRDRLHRERQRTFGAYEQNTLYSATGQLLSHTFSDPMLNREYGYNDNGQLARIRGLHQEEDCLYDGAGRLISARHNDRLQHHATDPAGNRLADREQYPALPVVWRNNRIREDVHAFYHHDEHGRLAEKDERQIRDGGGYVHAYRYDNQHRLVHYRCEQQGTALRESRYLYDPLGRRIGKRVWKSQRTYGEITGNEYIQLSPTPEVTWYGWDGDRLTTTETATQRVQTIYMPGSFTPLVRIETETAELAKAVRRTLAEKFQQEANMTFPPELVALVELQCGELSEANRAWLAQCGLTPEQIQNQMEPEYIPQRKIHLYHCDHRSLPLALVSHDGKIEWSAEYDAWGNVFSEHNPHNMKQLIRLPGQQYDEETGLYYNRHRYYDPLQGRYITQDPIGWRGEWSLYTYPLNPLKYVDPLGLDMQDALGPFVNSPGVQAELTKSMAEYSEAAKPVSMRPDGNPWGYGCGDEKSDWYVPDGLFGVDFMPACRAHDKCYETKGKDKAYCDNQLGENIALACTNTLKNIPSSDDILNLCYTSAGIFELAVEKKGGPAYEAAQGK